MRISYSWLKEFIDFSESPEKIAELLTQSGLEVEHIEEVEQVKGGLKGVVIGEVLTCKKHPDADKLSLTTVHIGAENPVQIVCGAPNVAAGQKVVVATVDTTLYPTSGEPFKIKKSKIRGEISEGMICAEDEIGLGKSHEGIMVLQTELANGTPAARYFNLSSDYVFEIGLTPNRADAASHWGVARDLKSLLNKPIKMPEILNQNLISSDKFQVEIQNMEACPRYSGAVVKNVKIAESPQWLKNRLKSLEINPTNNIVDITNYVLHELGQPLHAFDLNKIKGSKVIVKSGFSNQKFTTLDDKERALKENDLMICNAQEPMCIAGILGGKDSGINDSTTDIFIESAYFSPDFIRKSAMHHGIKTDASFRFERGTDPQITLFALQRALKLITEIAGGTVEICTDNYPKILQSAKIDLSLKYLNKLIGKEIGINEVKKILHNLDFEITSETSDILSLLVPTYRVDVLRQADVVEEILRIYGYNNISETQLDTSYFAPVSKPNKHHFKNVVFEMLTGFGFTEIFTNSLSNSKYYNDHTGLVKILNFNSEDLDIMRPDMLFSGLEILQNNANRKQKNLKLFEVGKVYGFDGEKYNEQEKIALYISGNKQAETWQFKAQKSGVEDLLNVLNVVLQKLGFDDYKIHKSEKNQKFKQVAHIKINDKIVGETGVVQNILAEKFDLEEVFFAELDWSYLTKKVKTKVKIDEISKFPEVKRDLSLVIDKKITFEDIKQIAEKYEKKLLQNINVFDVYEGDNLGEGKKSYSVSFILQDKTQTLTDKIIDSTMNKLINAYEKELGALIRR